MKEAPQFHSSLNPWCLEDSLVYNRYLFSKGLLNEVIAIKTVFNIQLVGGTLQRE